MSEYQYVAFRALDGPVSDKNLKYMRSQSSRATITPLSFTNEYNYGDFHGNAIEMLRRGYDIHLHYANFGVRTLLIRMPTGLPDPAAAKKYLDGESLTFTKDKAGKGGILAIQPYFEPDGLDEIGNPRKWLDRLIPLREELLEGDLRPLYIAHLAASFDDNHDREEAVEGPVPAGLAEVTAAQRALAKFHGLSRAMLAAAAGKSPPLSGDAPGQNFHKWLMSLSSDVKDKWLADWMANANSSARMELLLAYRQSQPKSGWPTVKTGRTIAALESEAKAVQDRMDAEADAAAQRERAKTLAKVARNPKSHVKQVHNLVDQRSTSSYEEAGAILADLRDALAGSKQASLAADLAVELHNKYRNRSTLTTALRNNGLLPKKSK